MFQLSTNSFYPGGYSKGIPSNVEYWDDFDGPNLKSTAFLQRLAPSGHQYYLHGAADGTNGFLMRGGKLVQTNNGAGVAFYLSVSNSHPQGRIWTRFGFVVRYSGVAYTPIDTFSQAVLLMQENAILTGSSSFLHMPHDPTSGILRVQSNVSLTLGQSSTLVNTFTTWAVIDVHILSNAVVALCNERVLAVSHTNLHNIARWPVVTYEIAGTGTNRVFCEIESAWAGYADPAVMLLASDQSSTRGWATLSSGLATVLTPVPSSHTPIFLSPYASANPVSLCVLSNVIPGTSFQIRSMSATDANRVYWWLSP